MKKWYKRIFIVLMFFSAAALVLIFFNRKYSTQSGDKQSSDQIPVKKIGLITGFGGLGDKSFNDMQYKGMILARKRFKVDFEYLSPHVESDDIPMMEELIAKKCEVIICGGGYHQSQPVDILAKKHPDVTFVLLDEPALNYHKNVASVTYKQNEGSFLVGALAALMSKTGKIAVIGALDLPIINDFIVGYEAGAQAVKPTTIVKRRYVADEKSKLSPFSDPETAKKIALKLYQREGVDVIFQVASASGLGVFSAAKEQNKYAIGVDCDQDYLAEGNILTSMMKNLDLSVQFIVEEVLNNSFVNQNYAMGLKEYGVTLSPMTFTIDKIPKDVLGKIDSLKAKIMSGELKVPSVY